jgi:3-methyladenine DNA glycosylase Tag
MQPDHFTKPTSASGYLAAMTRIIFTSGINWRVVESKWEGIRDAFAGFDIQKVANMGPDDVERLVTDARVIRNRRKIEAIIGNAGKIEEVDKSHGGFDKYLRSLGSYEKQAAALKRDFSFMGDSTAYFFLAIVGEQVPDWEHHAHKMRRRPRGTRAVVGPTSASRESR